MSFLYIFLGLESNPRQPEGPEGSGGHRKVLEGIIELCHHHHRLGFLMTSVSLTNQTSDERGCRGSDDPS